MKYVLYVLFAAIISVQIGVWQLEGNIQNVSVERMKNGVNRAAHAAVLQVKNDYVADGFIVFDEEKKDKVFKDTLKTNLMLDDHLHGLEDTLFQGEVEIVFQDFIDESVDEFGNPTSHHVEAHPYIHPPDRTPFDNNPKLYRYTDPEGHFVFSNYISGPSVVYVIKAQKPIQIGKEEEEYLYLGSIYQYPSY